MKKFIFFLPLFLCGCSFMTDGNAEWSIDFRQGITISTKETNETGDASKASADAKPLLDHILEYRANEPMDLDESILPE